MIDWERVCDLYTELGAADFAPMMEFFLDEIEATLMRFGPQNAKRLELDLHALRGAALNLGFARFAEICLTNERFISQDLASKVDLDQVSVCYTASKAEFTRLWPNMVKEYDPGASLLTRR